MYKVGDIIVTNEEHYGNGVAEITSIELDYWGDGSMCVAYRIKYLVNKNPHPRITSDTNCISVEYIQSHYFPLINSNIKEHNFT
jgi:hypothetical protein